MFESVLIANRGEVAVRVIKACRALGVRAIAVCSEPDENALHVRLADEVVKLGGTTPAESYLDHAAVTRAILETDAQALHPGYGFLSESGEFAQKVDSLGVAFIGPSASAIDQMGSKIAARRVAEAAGVPAVPGLTTEITTPEQIERFGAQHGYPIAIKASFGGGGRGMRVVREASEITAALEAAQREATAYFGRGEVYLEKYLEHPRHVEMQILADKHGNCVWLGERDCSVQRRHQKLVEESPAFGLSAETRAAMGEAAIAIAKAVDYTNAGTIEFLYQDGEFWFLEMNTRLQVEHPVTEMTSGIDIVAEQIRIAAGERLTLDQEALISHGHAIEMRINAEDPSEGLFAPTPGRIEHLDVPTGSHIRFDGGYESGDTVSQFYDSLIGKLIVTGEDRDTAIDNARQALADFVVDGVSTTIPAHRVILEHADFRAGRHDTRWLETTVEFPATEPALDRSMAWINDRLVWIPRALESTVSHSSDASDVLPGPSSRTVTRPKRAVAEGVGPVVAPLQGTVVAVHVENGQTVTAGEVVCVLEAMKMENEIKANRSGVVTELAVEVGSSLGPGSAILNIN